VDTKGAQRERLGATVKWARKLRSNLQLILDEHGSRVHFRPSSTGITMVGLVPERPQRGRRLQNLASLADDFEAVFTRYCCDIDHGRPTEEKELQSFLIRESYRNGRRIEPINGASRLTDESVDLMFVTDEIALPLTNGKTVCDVLAFRRDGGRSTPVLLELKNARDLTRLVAQVEGYAALIDMHADLFAELFGALLGERIHFDAPTEKWIVWPAARPGPDPNEGKLASQGIRVVTYTKAAGRFDLRVGRSVCSRGSKAWK